jgi:hypothetical protein
MRPLTRTTATPALTIALAALSLAATACGPQQHAVCEGKPEHVIVVPSTSESEYETSLELAPGVVRQAVERVASSCGRLTVGIMTNNPERDLELRSTELVPSTTRAYNTQPIRRELVERGQELARTRLLAPLERSEPTKGSPFLRTYAKIGREVRAHRWGRATVISIGDGLVVERSPGTNSLIRFDRGAAPDGVLNEFMQILETLRGSCVILVGQGATDGSGPSPERIRAAERLLGKTLNQAGVGFVATRSRDLPPGCTMTADRPDRGASDGQQVQEVQ